jgi:hypothetical protein
MAKFAAQTEVSSEQSQAEIKRTLTRYGASRYAYYEDDAKAAIGFEFKERRLKFVIPLPDRRADEFIYTPGRRTVRDVAKQHGEWEKACRQRWRALALAIKAKLEVVESGIATFEEEFLSYMVLPDGQTVGEFVIPQIEMAYLQGKMPPLLPGIGETTEIN